MNPGALRERVRHAAKERKLRLGVIFALLSLFVGHGKVRVYPLCIEAGESAGAGDVIHTLVKMLPRDKKAQAGHTRVELYVDFKRPAECGCRGGVFQRLGQARDGLGNGVIYKGLGVFMRRVAEDEDGHGYPALAQLQRFIEAGNGEVIRPGALQKLRHLQRAVAVGIGLYHAQKAARGRYGGAYGLVVAQ